jgi:hypothetical protein
MWNKSTAFAAAGAPIGQPPWLPAGLPEPGRTGWLYAKTLSFFSASRACSIDFGWFDPMFRLNAALDRNAIPWFAARQRKTAPPAS